MTKQEFIKNLKLYLNGNIGDSDLDYQISYYDNYISNEIRNGKNESDIINELGDPKLIAKTIIDLHGKNNQNDYVETNSNKDNNTATDKEKVFKKYNQNGLGCILSSLILLVIVMFIFRLIGFIFAGTFYVFGGSGIIIIILILIVINYFMKKNNGR